MRRCEWGMDPGAGSMNHLNPISVLPIGIYSMHESDCHPAAGIRG